jgi:methionyl aminopeptidase
MSKKIMIKTPDQIEGIRQSSILAAKTLRFIAPYIQEGVSTAYLDNKIEEFIRDHKAIPAPLNYRGYPKSSCISLNEVVCHGIPSESIILKNGDILNVDVTTILDGYYGDTSTMFYVGEISEQVASLLKITKKCLDLGIMQCFPGNPVGNIGYEIGKYAREVGCGVVYEFCGHGVGIEFHEEPEIAHIADKNSGKKMQPGMTFTIEPMINQGKARTIIDKKDGWTARTIDGKLSAQYEHTILITEKGCDVLTDIDNEYPKT